MKNRLKTPKKNPGQQVIGDANVTVVRDVSPSAVTAVEPDTRSRGEVSSALSLYMREVGAVDLLTPEEEIELAARIKRGDEAARERMIRANLRLVVKIAREYEGLGLPLLDLINEGNIGLMQAVERFDPAKGAKLSTYSSWWIRQAVRRGLANQSKTIRLPIYVVDQLYHLGRASIKLREIFGREPEDHELASELNLTTARIAELRRASVKPVSLDAPVGEDDSSRLGELVADENTTSPDTDLNDRNLTGIVKDLVKQLNPREATILRHRFGLDGSNEKTLEEIGAKFGVTRERIRQLQNEAITKLRRMLKQIDFVSLPA